MTAVCKHRNEPEIRATEQRHHTHMQGVTAPLCQPAGSRQQQEQACGYHVPKTTFTTLIYTSRS
jgi:hypothetical protein